MGKCIGCDKQHDSKELLCEKCSRNMDALSTALKKNGLELKPEGDAAPPTLKCRAGTYTTNEGVARGALVCWGGFGLPQCEHLDECANERGLPPRRSRK